MKVLRSEGVANRTGPESCVAGREASGEALTGVRVGWPSSRVKWFLRGADVFVLTEGHVSGRATASTRTAPRGRRPQHARTLLVREPGDLPSDRRVGGGPHREDRRGRSR